MYSSRLACTLLVLSLFAAGCQRLNIEKTYHLDPGSARTVEWDPPKYDQKVTVNVQAKGGPVTAYLVKTENLKEVADRAPLGQEPRPGTTLDGAKDKEAIEFTVDISKGTAVGLVVASKSTIADVTIKVTGR